MNLPSAPLERLVRNRNLTLEGWTQADQRAFYRAVAKGHISDRMADRLCIKHLDIQPELLWPELLSC